MPQQRTNLADALERHGWQTTYHSGPRSIVAVNPGAKPMGAVDSVYIGPRGAIEARIVGRRTPYSLGRMGNHAILVWLGVEAPPDSMQRPEGYAR
ncbi:MAG: hypothetical protein H6515_13090 [Microthrixaceae bacterium]|nr:hypothetical protein [Microthrixaceae bacterium]